MEEKLRDYFEEMVVYKDLKNNTGFFSSLGLPAFLRDYLLKTFSDEYGRFNMDRCLLLKNGLMWFSVQLTTMLLDTRPNFKNCQC